MDQHPLDGICQKLVRAEKHLNEIMRLLEPYAEGECNIVPEKNFERAWTVLRIQITPKANPELSAVAGDFFFNVRSVLDHLVWQLILTNPPARPGPSNQFPICESANDFADALRRKRLRGVPEKARALIESLQPYNTGDNPLGMLNKLHNIDKHRALNITTVVADNTELLWQMGDRPPELRLILGNEELRHGAQLGNFAVPFDLPPKFAVMNARMQEMKVYGKCSLFVAFHDETAEDLEDFRVDRVVKEIFYFVRDEVIPAFDPFLDSTSDAV